MDGSTGHAADARLFDRASAEGVANVPEAPEPLREFFIGVDVISDGGLVPFGIGYRSTLRVRLIHALVRRHVSAMPTGAATSGVCRSTRLTWQRRWLARSSPRPPAGWEWES
jgi:hypothetical protein